ncbi:MAG: cytochrome c biogenesis protein CcsA [Chthonomonadales bacterium]
MNTIVLHIISLAFYIIASCCFIAELYLRKERLQRIGTGVAVAGAGIHTLAIGWWCATVHQTPFAANSGTLSVAAWILAISFLPVRRLTKIELLGAFAMPMCSLLTLFSLLRMSTSVSTLPYLRTSLTSLHVILILGSFALLLFAGCCALFYIWQYGQLKSPSQEGRRWQLPPLETVDHAAFGLVAVAHPILTVGLILGFVSSSSGIVVARPISDPHVILSLAAWALCSAYLVLRLAVGWRGSRINWILIGATVLSILLYFLPSTTHRFS